MLGLVGETKEVGPAAKEIAALGYALAGLALAKAANDWESIVGELNAATHGTTALFHMLSGEFSFALQNTAQAKPHLVSALTIFKRVPVGSVGGLVLTCEQLLAACP
jgi:hypothetical protein